MAAAQRQVNRVGRRAAAIVPFVEHRPAVHKKPDAIIGLGKEAVEAAGQGHLSGPAHREAVGGQPRSRRARAPAEIDTGVVADQRRVAREAQVRPVLAPPVGIRDRAHALPAQLQPCVAGALVVFHPQGMRAKAQRRLDPHLAHAAIAPFIHDQLAIDPHPGPVVHGEEEAVGRRIEIERPRPACREAVGGQSRGRCGRAPGEVQRRIVAHHGRLAGQVHVAEVLPAPIGDHRRAGGSSRGARPGRGRRGLRPRGRGKRPGGGGGRLRGQGRRGRGQCGAGRRRGSGQRAARQREPDRDALVARRIHRGHQRPGQVRPARIGGESELDGEVAEIRHDGRGHLLRGHGAGSRILEPHGHGVAWLPPAAVHRDADARAALGRQEFDAGRQPRGPRRGGGALACRHRGQIPQKIAAGHPGRDEDQDSHQSHRQYPFTRRTTHRTTVHGTLRIDRAGAPAKRGASPLHGYHISKTLKFVKSSREIAKSRRTGRGPAGQHARSGNKSLRQNRLLTRRANRVKLNMLCSHNAAHIASALHCTPVIERASAWSPTASDAPALRRVCRPVVCSPCLSCPMNQGGAS